MYHLLIIVVALLAVVRGYRRGLTGQVTSVLGLAFGVICTHIFIPGVSDVIGSIIGRSHLEEGGEYLTGNIAALLIYGSVYLLFRSITGIVRQAARMLGTSLLDSLLGAAFCIFNYLLVLSMVLNVLVGYNPDSPLMRDGRSDDGNLVNLVLCIAPATLGSESFDDFAHRMQLRDARKISCAGEGGINYHAGVDVISVAVRPAGEETNS
ncbi:MAG: CvpA family protein [Muribaculaceae bacterium]|nr:CvpA family protein [Muribaculaceae bacterium]